MKHYRTSTSWSLQEERGEGLKKSLISVQLIIIYGIPLIEDLLGESFRVRFPFLLTSSYVDCRLNDLLGLSLNDRTILFEVILLDKTESVG